MLIYNCPIRVQEAGQPMWHPQVTVPLQAEERQALHKSRAHCSLMLSLRVFPMSLPTLPGSHVSCCPLLAFSDLQENVEHAEGQAVQTRRAQRWRSCSLHRNTITQRAGTGVHPAWGHQRPRRAGHSAGQCERQDTGSSQPLAEKTAEKP